ncbi:MFS transporter [Ktedonospora formicarum]|uniref:Major facilitator superfamily (MFS) profile domain-containing protein n=1 Tax=Ktedonospora formicarum TaxID=2778364 RepID=A0A8J3MNX9_9CHLR|nr:MFS transporter [Ktedonospora formicarum]GHO42370.1 hypothetical protein KSX_05330 [Ktedonospora formicarum]
MRRITLLGQGQRWRRIVPMVMVTAALAALDQINLSFALPSIGKELAIGATLVGVVGGVLSLGALLAHAPGGYWVSKWGPRRIVALGLIAWGALALANSGVQNTAQLMIVRFVLGVVEGITTPALLVLLSRWFPLVERARANAYWMFCFPLAALILRPLIGWLLTFTTWRTLFLIEGIIPLLWVPCWWLCIADKPELARWLQKEERDALIYQFGRDAAHDRGIGVIGGGWSRIGVCGY